MEKLDGKTLDLAKENIKTLKKLFPEVVTEGKIDFEKLKLILGEEIDDHNERYEFTWYGKAQSMKLAQTPSTGTLRPDKESSKNWDKTKNLYIEGDNLEVLKLLQKSYFGKVKMIYIDPPYNTGKDFVYEDDFRDNIKNYKEITKQTTKSNSETNGRFHTDWLNMMYPRLKIAKNLLQDDGVLLISIDENEDTNLRKVCDEIFGENNFVGEIIRKTKSSTNDPKSNFNNQHDYILIYRKTDRFSFKGIEKDLSNYKNPDNDPNGEWVSGDPSARSGGDGTYFEIVNPYTNKVDYPPKGRYWAFNKQTYEKYVKSGRIKFKKSHKENERGFIFKNYKRGLKSLYKPFESLYFTENNYMNQVATKELNDIGLPFDYPKPLSLLKKLIKSITDKEDIILDFFSGSSTTAHAIMELNAEDNGDRKFIMVQLPEPTEEKSNAYKAGYKYITDIGKERIRRAGDIILKETAKSNLDIGFKVFKLDTSNVKTWDPDMKNLEQNIFELQDNIKEDRTKEDLLYEILLKIGIPLTAPIEEIQANDKTIYNVGFGGVLLCLENEIDLDIVHKMIELKPEEFDSKVIFKETGFLNDSVKTNAIQTLKKNGITDVRSV